MLLFMIFVISAIFHHGGAGRNFGCPSKVYLEYMKPFVVNCNFPQNYESVFWYEIPDQGPFISYQNDVKSGAGYSSGEFDIKVDGSLVIQNATLDLEGQMRVFVHYEEWENDIRQTVDLTVFVKTHQDFPYIDACKDKRYCHVVVEENQTITCFLNETRPASKLTLLNRYGSNYSTLSSNNFEINGGHIVSSFVSSSVTIKGSHLLEVIVCLSSNRAPVVTANHSMILTEKAIDDYSSKLPIYRLCKTNNNLELGFDEEDVFAAVWKKRLSTGIYQTIGFFFYGVSESQDETFEINTNGLLVIERFQFETEGEYLAVYATPTSHGYKRFQVHVFIAPNPPFPSIFGCLDEQNCVLHIANNGRLECSLEGIRPLVHLEWIFNGKGDSPIMFSSPLLSVANRGLTYDSSVTTSFFIKPERHLNFIDVACQVADRIDGLSTMRSNITLYIAPEYMVPAQMKECEDYYRIGKILLIVGATLTSVLVLLCCCGLCLACLAE